MDNAWTVITAFRQRHDKAYGMGKNGGPPWNDGSMVSSLLCVIEIQGMVHNGGWPAVYYNGLGWMVPIAIAGYLTVGSTKGATLAQRAATAVRSAEESRPGVSHDSEDWLSDQLMEIAGGELELIDEAWMERERTEDLYDLVARFIVSRGLLG